MRVFSGKPFFLAATAAAVALLVTAGPARAGQRCDAARPTPQVIERGLALAQRTAEALERAHQQSGMRVALLARAGQDLSRYHQHWSHVGWAYRTPEGPWRVVHKLNTCGSDQSTVMRQGLGEFFLDDMWRYEAGWRPAPAHWQDALWQLLQNDAQTLLTLHEPRYSMVSYAWGTRYQQSNQWALETLALAAEPGITRRAQAQDWLRRQDYQAAEKPPSAAKAQDNTACAQPTPLPRACSASRSWTTLFRPTTPCGPFG